MNNKLNQLVAEQLREIADLLEQQEANIFRVNAYRRAAQTVDQLEISVQKLIEQEGIDGLISLPAIGKGIARTIYEIVATGRSSRLENLRGELDPIRLFQTIPVLGPELAQRLYEHLQVDTLEALEVAAHDGRLEKVPGVGLRRATAIRAALTNMLGRRIPHRREPGEEEPEVAVLLEVDREYREKETKGELSKIAPRRFNPKGEAWLPILHTMRDGWHFTALYSNTARAHELNRTHDWVVMYYYDDHHHEAQHTIVTETHGALVGKRVVRGRETECRTYYSTRQLA